jgi:hypothetical protein
LVLGYNARDEEAVTLLKDALAGRITRLGDAHPATLEIKFRLAGLSPASEQKVLLREVIDAQATDLGDDHPSTLLTKQSLATLCLETGDEVQAETLYRELVETCNARLGSGHPLAQQNLYFLAHHFIGKGEFDKAEPLVRAGAESRKQVGIEQQLMPWFLRQLVVIHQHKGERDQAESLLRESLQYWKKKAGADSTQYAITLADLGSSLLEREGWIGATPLLREALSIQQMKQPDHWQTFHTRWLLGASLVGQKDDREAEPLMLAGFEGLKQREESIPSQYKTQLTESLKHLVRRYEALQKPDQASKWRKELEARTESEGSTDGQGKR